MSDSIREGIEKAAADLGITEDDEHQIDSDKDNQEVEKPKTDKPKTESTDKDEEVEDSETEVEDEEESNEDAEEIQTALNILRALRDPKQSRALIHDFAVQAGIIDQNQDLTKKQEKSIADLVKEQLGDEYPDLTEKLTGILKASEEANDRKIKALEEKLENEKKANAQKTFAEEFDGFIKTNKVTAAESEAMVKVMRELPPNGNVSLTKYLLRIKTIVDADKLTAKSKVDQAERRTKNQNANAKQFASGADDDRIKQGSKLPTYREAINAAMRGEKLE